MAPPERINPPLLTPEEEIDLAQRIEVGVLAAEALSRGDRPHGATRAELAALVDQGVTARRQFIEANLRLVGSVTRQAALRSRLTEADLFQEGCLGLMMAVDRYDCRRGCRFATYAVPWIRAYAGAASARLLGDSNLPASRAEQLRRARGVESALTQTLGRSATEEEVAAALGRTRTWTSQLLQYEHPQDLAVAGDIGTVDRDLERVGSAAADVAGLLSVLNGLDRRVLELRMGFGGDPLSYAEIARLLGVTANRARRAEHRALDRLRGVCPHAARDELAG